MIIVAKMYVASVTKSAGFGDTHTSNDTVNLNCVYSPDPNTENHSFWKASPNGTLRLTFPYNTELPDIFKPGAIFKVYHVKDKDGKWRLNRNEIVDGRMDIMLTLINEKDWYMHTNGREEMSIDNKDVFCFYADISARFNLSMVEVDKEGNALSEPFLI